MVKNKTPPLLPKTFETDEEMADFWDTHDVTDYEEYLTPVDVNISTHPKHKYVITLSDSLDTTIKCKKKRVFRLIHLSIYGYKKSCNNIQRHLLWQEIYFFYSFLNSSYILCKKKNR